MSLSESELKQLGEDIKELFSISHQFKRTFYDRKEASTAIRNDFINNKLPSSNHLVILKQCASDERHFISNVSRILPSINHLVPHILKNEDHDFKFLPKELHQLKSQTPKIKEFLNLFNALVNHINVRYKKELELVHNHEHNSLPVSSAEWNELFTLWKKDDELFLSLENFHSSFKNLTNLPIFKKLGIDILLVLASGKAFLIVNEAFRKTFNFDYSQADDNPVAALLMVIFLISLSKTIHDAAPLVKKEYSRIKHSLKSKSVLSRFLGR